jgi:DNA-binding transcriptional MocR family regulator
MDGANQSKLASFQALLHGWTSGPGPLQGRLAAALAAAIDRGDLPPGTRLPTERSLADRLGVGRGTVAAAYRAMERGGLVSRRQGSGTWVELTKERAAGPGDLGSAGDLRLLAIRSAGASPGTIDLTATAPAGVPELGRLAAQAARELGRLAGHPGLWPLGYPPLRREIARRLAGRGLPTREDEVLVTTGAQQAIALTALAFVAPGDFVVLEDPTYPGAIDAYRRVGARILGLTVGPAGIELDHAADVLRRAECRLIYTTPTFQNPTGTLMPAGARSRLTQLAAARGALIADDEVQADLTLGEPPPPPLAAFAEGDRVITIGSLSKVFWSGLRVGWIRAPRPLLSQLARFKAVLDLGGSVPGQVLAALLLQHAGEIVPRRLDEMRARRDLMCSLVSTLLPDWRFEVPSGGFALWARLPSGSASQFAEIARAHGVAILPGPMLSAGGRFDDRVRLAYVASPDVLEEAVRRIARAWSAYAAGEAAGDRGMGVIV